MRWLAWQTRVETPIQQPAERKIAKNKPKSSFSSRFGIAQAELLHPNTDIDDSRGIVGGYRQSQWRVPMAKSATKAPAKAAAKKPAAPAKAAAPVKKAAAKKPAAKAAAAKPAAKAAPAKAAAKKPAAKKK
jgi:hypothetical protein